MNKTTHRIYISTLVLINLLVLAFLIMKGFSYYQTPVVDRFFHEDHSQLKPSGPFGHGYGIVGSLLILIGVFSYIARKKYQSLAAFGRLKYWLEFHIFLCVLGPMLILFHTAFKFGGIVSLSFWSMVLVVASGVIGRFIYIQIPRSIEGRELSLAEVQNSKINLHAILSERYEVSGQMVQALLQITDHSLNKKQSFLRQWILEYFTIRSATHDVQKLLAPTDIDPSAQKSIIRIMKQEIKINGRINRLTTMQTIFRYWHVIHLPFAIIMLIIMIIHVIVTLSLGYKWIF